MAPHRWGLRSWFGTASSLIGPIWRTWNDSAVAYSMTCLQTASVTMLESWQQSAKRFAGCGPKSGMAWHRWGLRSWFGTASSLIGPIWRTWNDSAASYSVTCLQTASVMLESWRQRQSAKRFACHGPKTKSGMARHRWGLRSWFGTASSLIGPIWRTWNDSAASYSVTCLQTASDMLESWRQSAKRFACHGPKSGMAQHRWGLRSWFGTASSLIGPIWRTWNDSAAAYSVTCIQTASVLLESWRQSAKRFCLLWPKKWHG
jgi:catabolite regulation protein CreA